MTYLTVACVQEDLFQVGCYSPLRIPEGSRRDIAEALVRDFDDGELRFRWPKSSMAARMLMSVVYGNEEAPGGDWAGGRGGSCG